VKRSSTEGFVTTKGAKIYYKIMGDGDPVVVVHGGPGFDHMHMLPISLLADSYKLVFFDQRASGRSTGKVDRHSINAKRFVDDLEKIRNSLGLGKIHILGHSWGAMLSLLYSITYPDRLRTMVLLAPSASFEHLDQYSINIQKRTSKEDREAIQKMEQSSRFKKRDPRAVQEYYRVAVKPFFHDNAYVYEMDLSFGKRTAKNQSRISELLIESLGEFNIHSRLSRITCPVLVVHGESDPLPKKAPTSVHRNIPQSEFLVLRNTGHFMFVEALDKLLDSIRGFFEKTTPN